MRMKKPTAVTITDPSPVSSWAERSPGWISWSSSRLRCQSKIFSKAAIFLLFFSQNLPQCPFSPPASCWHLWQTQFSKSKMIFTVQNALQYCCSMFPSQSHEEDRKKQNYLHKDFLWQNLNADVTAPTSLGNFPVIGKNPTRENSLLLTVIHCNQRQICWENWCIKYHRHLSSDRSYMSNSPGTSVARSHPSTHTQGPHSINFKWRQTAANNDWKLLHNLLTSAKVISWNNRKSIAYLSLVRTDILSPRLEPREGPLPCHYVVQELLSLCISFAKNKGHCLFLNSRSHSRIQKKNKY